MDNKEVENLLKEFAGLKASEAKYRTLYKKLCKIIRNKFSQLVEGKRAQMCYLSTYIQQVKEPESKACYTQKRDTLKKDINELQAIMDQFNLIIEA